MAYEPVWLERIKDKNLIDANHAWGYQVRLVNTEEYCSKLLVLNNETPGSYHFHHRKKETFIVLHGIVGLRIDHDSKLATFRVGEQVTFEPNEAHQMVNLDHPNPSIILEVSTHDDDEDTFRLSQRVEAGRDV